MIDLAAECPPRDPRELLAEFARTGDQSPFEEIVRRYGAMVYNVCYEVTSNRHDSEDATQAAFLSLAVQARSGQQILAIGPWLQQVARRMSLDINRSRRRRKTREEKHSFAREDRLRESASNGDGNGHAPDRAAGWEELRHVIQEEIDQLPAKYRAPLLLHYYGGMSREEMAKELGCRTNTLGVRLHRAREMLGKRLSKRGVALSAVMFGVLLTEVIRSVVSQRMIESTAQAALWMSAGHPYACGLVSAEVASLARNAGVAIAAARVKIAASFALFAGGAFAAGAEVAAHVGMLGLPRLGDFAPSRLIEKLFKGGDALPEMRVEATKNQDDQAIAGGPAAPAPQWVGMDNRAAGGRPLVTDSNPKVARSQQPPPPITPSIGGAVDAQIAGLRSPAWRDVGPTPGTSAVATDAPPVAPKPGGSNQPTPAYASGGGGGGGSGGASGGTGPQEPPLPPGRGGVKPRTDVASDGFRPPAAPRKLEVQGHRPDDGLAALGPELNAGPGDGSGLVVTVPKPVTAGGLNSGTGKSPVSSTVLASRNGSGGQAGHASGSGGGGGTYVYDRANADSAGGGSSANGASGSGANGASGSGGRLVAVASGSNWQSASNIGPRAVMATIPDWAAPPQTPATDVPTPAPGPVVQPAPQPIPVPETTPAAPFGGTTSGGVLQISTAYQAAGAETFDQVLSGGRGPALFQVDAGQSAVSAEVVLGYSGTGVAIQTGGTNAVDALFMGVMTSGRGLYQLTGGELAIRRTPNGPLAAAHSLEIGSAGEGVFLIGGAGGTGQVTETGDGRGVDLKVGGSLSAKATLRGWGKVGLTGTLTNGGQVIADGYGQLRTLDLTSFAHVDRNYRNRDTRGWYALNKGALALPVIGTAAGTGTYTWGDDAATPTISYVNAVRATVTDAADVGDLAISLLALDRDDVPARPEGHHFIGLWSWSLTGADGEPLTTGGVDLAVRYDAALAADLGLDENVLKLWKYEAGNWVRLDGDPTFVRDTELHTLTVHVDGNELTYFAVSAPEPGAIGVIVVGAGVWLGRRRRR
ncbi:MAG TPA: sigma-70 family RNA polymerase sigma factor [Tepidisphaeraceae bacterium]|nr:sigma-70 family RNA polymerase sigma factor [Tepidisphaeraceae bacterium]